jgi:hypothetical protein
MKRLEKLFCVLLCMIFLFACSHIHWLNTTEVSLEWDAVPIWTDGSSNESPREVRYLLYVGNPNTHEGELLEKYVNGVRIDAKTPIAETSCKIRIKDKGKFLVGVQSVLYVDDKTIYGHSIISWSDSKIATQNNPFGVRVKK